MPNYFQYLCFACNEYESVFIKKKIPESMRQTNCSIYVGTMHPSKILQIYIPEESACTLNSRSSLLEVFCKKGVLKNFSNFAGKHLCQSVFFNKVSGPRRFPVNFAKHLRLTVSTLICWTEVEKVLIPYLTNLETFNELSRLFLKYKLVYHYVYCTLFGECFVSCVKRGVDTRPIPLLF